MRLSRNSWSPTRAAVSPMSAAAAARSPLPIGRQGRCAFTILEPNALRADGLPTDIAVMDGFLEETALAATGATTAVMCHMLRARDGSAGRPDGDPSRRFPPMAAFASPGLSWSNGQAKGVAGALNFEHRHLSHCAALADAAVGIRLAAKSRANAGTRTIPCSWRWNGERRLCHPRASDGARGRASLFRAAARTGHRGAARR